MAGGQDNLIPFDQRSEEERRRIAAEGGRASGAARRRKRSLREAADYFLSLPVSDRRTVNAMMRKGLQAEDIDNQMAVIVGLQREAAGGDARAAKLLFELIGEETENTAPENNLLEMIREAAQEAVDTSDLSETF